MSTASLLTLATRSSAIAIIAMALALPAWAQSPAPARPSAYPAKGQSAQQQAADDSQCRAWATETTGIDPVALATAPVPQSGPQGQRVRGAVRGAATGAVIGEIANGDAGNGAAVGAGAGVVAGGARARRNQAAQAQQGQAAKQQAQDTYNRAYGSCMQGRVYTVN